MLEAQLERMRGMLFGYSQLFFVHMRVYTLAALAILVASLWEPLGGAVLLIPFLVPFVFIEASYLFWYTVFARRHAEWVERTLATRTPDRLPAAHRLEAAYFYAPDSPKVAALDLRRPLSHMSAATLTYSAGAALLWLSGLILSLDWIGRQPDLVTSWRGCRSWPCCGPSLSPSTWSGRGCGGRMNVGFLTSLMRSIPMLSR